MPVLTSQFEAALTNIEPSEDDKTNAPEVHSQVSDALGADAVIAGWGFSAILIGSYKRHVSIRRIKDVDVFGRLIDLPDDVLPSTLLSEFERVLKAAFPAVAGKLRVKRQSRSLQVSFPEYDGLYVDAVPARPWTRDDGLEAWQLPKRGEQEWQATNPDELTRLTTEMNDADHHDGFYVPAVKLLRQTRRSLMGKRRPGGLVVEIAAYHAFASGLVTGPTHADYFASSLRETANILRRAFVLGFELDDPTMPGEKIVVRAEPGDKVALVDAFTAAATRAQEALDSDDPCAAAKTFQELLGKAVDDQGDSGYVFPMPPTCNADGTAKRFVAVTAGDQVVPAGNRRFG